MLIACLLLTACAPVVLTPAPIGPAELQRYADAATNTAAAVDAQASQDARQQAQATATGQSARETATAASLATLEALAARQTEAAVQLTSAAGAAAGTDAAAIRTQAARQTQVWATPTWAAVATGQALELAGARATATEIAARAAKSAAGAELLRGISGALTVAALLGGLAVAAVAVWWANRRQEIRTETYQELQWAKIDQARAETDRAKAEAIRAMIIERDSQPYLITPRGLVPMLAGGQPVQAANNRAREWRWRSACKAAAHTGVALGEAQGKTPRFGERDLASAEQPYVVTADGQPSSAGYRDLQRLLVRAGVWVVVDRKGTSWARGWNLERFEREFDALPLLNLPDGEPPEVRIVPRSSALPAVTAAPAAPQ